MHGEADGIAGGQREIASFDNLIARRLIAASFHSGSEVIF
jgi:hypothetical protein